MKLKTGTSCLGALCDPENYLYDNEVQNVITKGRRLKKVLSS